VLIIVVLNISIAVYTESSAQSSLAALAELAAPECVVTRNAEKISVLSENLVPGDIVHINMGDIVPADIRLISSSDLKVNEMPLTGESADVTKNATPAPAPLPASPVDGKIAEPAAKSKNTLTPETKLFAATTITSGSGTGVVVATGMFTRVGQIAALLSSDDGDDKAAGACCGLCNCPGMQVKRTPLQERLHVLGLYISCVALVGCALVFGIGLWRNYRDPEHPNNPAAVQLILVSVSLAVSAVPEGLPLAVTITLAVGTWLMARRHNTLIRNLPAVETLGAAQVICSDKTGTLTEGKMTAVKAWLPIASTSTKAAAPERRGKAATAADDEEDAIEHGTLLRITGTSNAPNGDFVTQPGRQTLRLANGGADDAARQLNAALQAVTLCSTAQLEVENDDITDSPAPAQVGQPQAEAKEEEEVEDFRALDAADTDDESFLSALKLARKWRVTGNATEAPLVMASAKGNVFAHSAFAQYPTVAALLRNSGPGGAAATPAEASSPVVDRRASMQVEIEVPFTSARKVMMSVVSVSDTKFAGLQLPAGTQWLAIVKGAPNYVQKIASCVANGQSLVTGASVDSSGMMQAVDALSAQALRVLAVAVCPLKELPYDGTDPALSADVKLAALKASSSWSLLGLFASIDPARAGVAEAVVTARNAGIRTVMITGDYLKTAIAIAKHVNVLSVNDDPDEAAVDCSVLRPFEEVAGEDAAASAAKDEESDDEEDEDAMYLPAPDMDELTSRVRVFARATPRDKLQIVRSLQRQGHVVAMTGDGVNDAPALQEADIGVAMGIAGTEVAKGASDAVLLDDSFATIVEAVRRGRIIFANLRTFVTFMLAANATQVIIILTCVSAGFPLPLTPVAILFLNLAVSGSPAMAMSVEPEYEGVMSHRPRPKDESILSETAIRKLVLHVFVLVGITLTAFLLGLEWYAGALFLDDLLPEGGVNSSLFCGDINGDGELSKTRPSNEDCTVEGIQRARALAFTTIMLAEIVRGFTVRSSEPLWVRPWRNPTLLKAQALSLVLTLLFLLIPALQGVMGLADIPVSGWFVALGLVLLSVVVDEIGKVFIRSADARATETQAVQSALGDVLLELRQLRHHLWDIEDSLGVREHRPAQSAAATQPQGGAAAGDHTPRMNRASSRAIVAAVSGLNVMDSLSADGKPASEAVLPTQATGSNWRIRASRANSTPANTVPGNWADASTAVERVRATVAAYEAQSAKMGSSAVVQSDAAEDRV